MSIKRGEIWLVDFEPSLGSEMRKTRPALVVSNNIANQKSAKVTLMPLTSTIKYLSITVVVEPDETNKLSNQSTIRVPDICTFDKQRLKHKIGILTHQKMKEVEEKLKVHLGL